MTKLDQLYALRAKVDEQIADEVRALEARAKAERERMSMIDPTRAALCGTDSGYYKHRRKYREPACTPCKQAHREAERDRELRRRASAA